MNIKIITISLLILLTGCAKDSIIHPTKPDPISIYESNLFIHDDNICMSTDEFLEFRLWLEDVKRYTIDVNDILCYYNKENC